MALIGTLKPSQYILGIILFTFFIMGGIALMGEFRKGDATFMSDSQTAGFNTTFNKYDTLTTSVTNLQGSVEDAGNEWGAYGVVGALVGSAWNSLRLLFSSFSFMNSIFLGLGMFGVPSWVGGLAILAVTVIFAFAIYSAIFKAEV
jgi:hypothetical protein